MIKERRMLFLGLLLFAATALMLSACGDDGNLCADYCDKAEYCASVDPDFVITDDCRSQCPTEFATLPQSVIDCIQACVDDEDCDVFPFCVVVGCGMIWL